MTFGRYAVQRHGSGVTLEILALPVIIRGTGKKDFPKELADCHLSDIPECVVIFMDEFPAKGIPKAAQSLIRPEVGVHIEDVVNRCVASPESARASIANPTLVSYKDYGCFVHMIALRLLKVYRISNPDKKSPGIFGKNPFWA